MDFKLNRKPYSIVMLKALLLLFSFSCMGQTASNILQQSIEYHDPTHTWDNFKAQLDITMQTPNSGDRHSLVTIDRVAGGFDMKVGRDGDIISRSLNNDTCTIYFNGDAVFSDEIKAKYKLTCDRTKMYRDYYTYLYGMPMKIKDEGAILSPEVQKVQFMGDTYWKLKVMYDSTVGSDTWYFYFNPSNYALQAYQFYHNEASNDGEYILLTDIIEYKNMKIPKVRKWYMNKDDKYLGMDILNNIKSL